ncbi:histone chaperone, partial [Tieghemiomyces parasiticus]
VDIKSKDKPDDLIAPTPNNTPIVTAPVQTLAQPRMAGSFAPNAALVSDLQGRLGSLVGASSGYVESLPAEVQRRLQGLKSLQ